MKYWTFKIPIDTCTDKEGDNLTYEVRDNGKPLPNWLEFDNSTLTFNGTFPLEERFKTHNLTIIASDWLESDETLVIVIVHNNPPEVTKKVPY